MDNYAMPERRNVTVRKYRIGEEPEVDEDVLRLTPSERAGLVWEVTKNAWAFANRSGNELRMRRDVASVTRRSFRSAAAKPPLS